jgi:lysophospholipase L1-like esterase
LIYDNKEDSETYGTYVKGEQGVQWYNIQTTTNDDTDNEIYRRLDPVTKYSDADNLTLESGHIDANRKGDIPDWSSTTKTGIIHWIRTGAGLSPSGNIPAYYYISIVTGSGDEQVTHWVPRYTMYKN